MSASCIISASLPSFWQSSDKNNFAQFFETRCTCGQSLTKNIHDNNICCEWYCEGNEIICPTTWYMKRLGLEDSNMLSDFYSICMHHRRHTLNGMAFIQGGFLWGMELKSAMYLAILLCVYMDRLLNSLESFTPLNAALVINSQVLWPMLTITAWAMCSLGLPYVRVSPDMSSFWASVRAGFQKSAFCPGFCPIHDEWTLPNSSLVFNTRYR